MFGYHDIANKYKYFPFCQVGLNVDIKWLLGTKYIFTLVYNILSGY